MRYTITLLFFMLSGVLAMVLGQTGIYTEKDIKSQDLLISAKKEIILGNIEEAKKIYEEMLGEYEVPAAAFELSRIYLLDEDFQQAESYAERAFKADPSNEWYLTHYAELLSQNGNDLRAAELLSEYTVSYPAKDVIYLKASYFYLKAEDYKEAIKILDRLETSEGITEEIIQRKFEIYDVMEKPKNALKELEKLSEAYPGETKYLHNVAGYLRTMGKDKEANDIMERILEIDPNDETAILFKGSTGKNKEADYLRSLVPIIQDQRISLDKKVMELIPYLEEFAENNDTELGQGLLDISLKLDENYPNNAKVKSILGDIHFYRQEWSFASDAYQASIEQDKSVWSVWNQLFLALNINGDFDQLLNVSSEAIDLYPNQPMAYLYNGLALIEKNDLSEAEMTIMEGAMIGGNNPAIVSESNYLQSRISLKNKDYESALSQIKESLSFAELNPFYLEQLGDIHAATDNMDVAKEAWRQAIKSGGNKDRLNKKISGQQNLNN